MINNNLYNTVFKWHFIAGLLSLPVLMLLSITGGIYLFKQDYEAEGLKSIQRIELGESRLSFEEQLQIAKSKWDRSVMSVVVPEKENFATAFVSGMFSHKSTFYVNPATGEVNGKVINEETLMHKVRKLHGELLLGGFGTKIVELVASWLVILLISGVYLFYPRGRGLKGFFTVRLSQGKRMVFRDIHALVGVWFSALLLLILAGGLPWTDVFGGNYKWLQEKTNAGFPLEWRGQSFESKVDGVPLKLDSMLSIAKELHLEGEVGVTLPKSEKSVFSVSNTGGGLSTMKMYHFDQYSGNLLKALSWDDIGVLMQTRLWVMAFHQGEFGKWNWYLVLLIAVALFTISVSAIVSYLYRKQKGSWSIPTHDVDYRFPLFLKIMFVVLGVVLPLFGVSLICIVVYEKLKKGV